MSLAKRTQGTGADGLPDRLRKVKSKRSGSVSCRTREYVTCVVITTAAGHSLRAGRNCRAWTVFVAWTVLTVANQWQLRQELAMAGVDRITLAGIQDGAAGRGEQRA